MTKRAKGQAGFSITAKHGFHITFENGWTVSVQFGPGNYAANYDRNILTDDEASGRDGSATAEVAYFHASGGLMPFEDGDTVAGYQTPTQVLALLQRVAALTPPLSREQGKQ